MDEKKYKYILDVKNLERNYYTMTPGGNRITYSVLKGVSFQVKPGEFIGIMGSSGCGKTTLLNIIAGLEQYDSGSVKMDGADVIGPGPNRGVIFQQYALFQPITLFTDNLLLSQVTVANEVKYAII